MTLVPMTVTAAREWVRRVHRHHVPPPGGLFAVGVSVDADMVGCAIVGRPVSRVLDDGWTAEVTRVATDGHENACSKLYGAARRAAKALGYRKVITYTLASEPGTSLRAAGWVPVATTSGGSWDRPSRQRVDKHPTEPKVRWEARP